MVKISDPQAFAAELNSALTLADGRFLDYAPTRRQAFLDTLSRLKDSCPAEVLAAVEESAETWADAAHEAGIRFGVAAEGTRRALTID